MRIIDSERYFSLKFVFKKSHVYGVKIIKIKIHILNLFMSVIIVPHTDYWPHHHQNKNLFIFKESSEKKFQF